jgi:uncharacterized protein
MDSKFLAGISLNPHLIWFLQMTPEPSVLNVSKGYLKLPSSWLAENPIFKFSIPMPPRFISPHPFTLQNTLALARGPLIYCLEDVDNPWVTDHFKTLIFSPSRAFLSEVTKTDENTGEKYVAVTASLIQMLEGGGWTSRGSDFIDVEERVSGDGTGPGVRTERIQILEGSAGSELTFVPFYYRANRKGKGMMRVGLRKS